MVSIGACAADEIPPGWNDTATAYPRDRCLHELFDVQVAARPRAHAAEDSDRVLTYGELKAQSDGLAARLRAAGVGRGDLVGLCGKRSLEALAAILGILKAGAAYVPLDDTYPPARLRAMAEDTEINVAVVLPGSSCRIRKLRSRVEFVATGAEGLVAVPMRERSASDCAYVGFTSGSTGRPKPVEVTHRGVVRLAVSDRSLKLPSPNDRVLHAFSLSSDGSTHEIWSALLNGACLVLVDREDLLSPVALEDRLHGKRVTFAYLNTSVFHHIARTKPEALSGLRFASAGGEALDTELTRAVLRACPQTTIVNFYGPTENSVVSTAYIVRDIPDDAQSVPIGRPLANSTAYVLRADGNRAGIGEEGELLVGGDGLALGYLGNPELTAERFVPNPFEPGSTLYRTGDRVLWRRDGNLEYRGRWDRQIKLRGHRIELDEIEARLRAQPSVGEAIVEVSANGFGDTLVAYVTPATPDGEVPVAEIRQNLASWLPAQAVPSRLIAVPRFPLTNSGKIDRQRLAAYAMPAPAAESAPSTVSDLQQTLAEVWQTTLRVRPSGADSFFDLGGDSMLAAEAITRTLAVLGINARHGSRLVSSLLRSPTLAEHTEAVRAVRKDQGAATAAAEVDFQVEATLGFRLDEPTGPAARWSQPRHVLLTGASGFVGAHLLDRLLRSTTATVHCPVRGRNSAHARQRVLANLSCYGLAPADGTEDRVIYFPADLTADRLGLSDRHFAELAESLDLIIHSAAEVNFLYPYSALKASNVDGTRTLVRMAARRRVPVHFLSTISVVAGFGTAGVRRVDENMPLDHADRLTMGYAESKWVAEKVLQKAAEQGLPIAIYRPYEVTGDQWRGICNTDTAICSLFRVFADMGMAPDVPLPMDFVPADYVASAIVHIATRMEPARRVYHLTNPKPAWLIDMIDRMREAGCKIKIVRYEQWVAELVRYVAQNPTHPAAPFVSLCIDRGHKTDISMKEMYFADVFPELGRDNIEHALARSLQCPPVDAALLDLYLEYFFASGYITRPRQLKGTRVPHSWSGTARLDLRGASTVAGDDRSGAGVAGETGCGEGSVGTEAADMLDPSLIIQIGVGFWPSKTLLSAVELGLFTTLGSGQLTGPAIMERLELRSRAVYDFLDGLVALRLLEREGQGEAALYRNTAETALFLDRNSPGYIGGALEMTNAWSYGNWGGLTEALRTGSPQNEINDTGHSMFEELYRDPSRLEQFMQSMAGASRGNFHALANKFDFSRYQAVCDVGGATGQLSIILVQRYPHLRCISFDLPVVEPIATRTIEEANLSDRIRVVSGDFFADPLPQADVIMMGRILHDWNLERKLQLIRAAFEALPSGGAFIVIEHLIDDDRRENVLGFMMSLNMLIEFGDGFDYTGADFRSWCTDVGFQSVEVLPLGGSASAGIAYK